MCRLACVSTISQQMNACLAHGRLGLEIELNFDWTHDESLKKLANSKFTRVRWQACKTPKFRGAMCVRLFQVVSTSSLNRDIKFSYRESALDLFSLLSEHTLIAVCRVGSRNLTLPFLFELMRLNCCNSNFVKNLWLVTKKKDRKCFCIVRVNKRLFVNEAFVFLKLLN